MYKHSKSWVNHSPSTDHLPDPGVEDSIPGSGCTSHPQDTALDFGGPLHSGSLVTSRADE